MLDFVVLENIKRYKQILADTKDPQKRETVRQLLLDEEARLNYPIPAAGSSEEEQGGR